MIPPPPPIRAPSPPSQVLSPKSLLQNKAKYECTKCDEKFLSIKEYINHLDHHENLMEGVKPKQESGGFFSKFFKKKSVETVKEGERYMAKSEDKDKEVTEMKEELKFVNERTLSLENTLRQINDTILDVKKTLIPLVKMHEKEEEERELLPPKAPPRQEVSRHEVANFEETARVAMEMLKSDTPPEPPAMESKKIDLRKELDLDEKRVVITVSVPARASGEFLNTIQKGNYELKDIHIEQS